MTQEQSNVAMLREAYAAWHETKGDANIWLDILADTVDWGSLADGRPGLEFSKPRSTKQQVVGYFEELLNDWSMDFYHINEYVAEGGRVVAIGECSWTHKRNGKTATVPKVDIWMFEDGKATQFIEFFDTHTAVMASQD